MPNDYGIINEVSVYDPGYIEPPDYDGADLDMYSDRAPLKRGDRFTIVTPQLIVVNADSNYITFTTPETLKARNRGRLTEAAIPAAYHFPYIVTKVFVKGEIAVDMNGQTWGYDGAVWRNRDGEEIDTATLRERGARVMPTELL